MSEGFRAGFVCLQGPTNAGKSTLMNTIIGEKVAITTPKPQTTRNRIVGIHNVSGRCQIVFVDTPGLHRAKGRLGRRLTEVAARSLKDTDLVLLVVDAARDIKARKGALSAANRAAAELVGRAGLPVMIALNQVDRIRDKSRLLPIIDAYRHILPAQDIVPVSALHGEGLPQLVDAITQMLPESPPLYPEDILSDQAERFMAAENIREQVMMATHQEVPYSVAVEVERWTESAERQAQEGGGSRRLEISAVIHVERESQKGIIIGAGGSRLKEIGTRARKALEAIFATSVRLDLFVRVEKDWSSNPRTLDRFGYR